MSLISVLKILKVVPIIVHVLLPMFWKLFCAVCIEFGRLSIEPLLQINLVFLNVLARFPSM